jgi:hypothetical protein
MIQFNLYKWKRYRSNSSSILFLRSFHFKIICNAIVVIALIICSSTAQAQKAKENYIPVLRGQVLNIEDGTPAAKAVVTNKRTQATVTADLNGIFLIKAFITDSLEVSSLGYQKETVSIPAVYNVSDILTIYVRPLSFLLPDINVKVKKEQMKIDKENRIVSPYFRRDMNIMREKPISEKIYDNQISILKISGGSAQRNERKIQEATNSESQWASVSKFYNKDVVIGLTGLNNTEADNLMIYINSKKLFGRMTTKENATFTILEQYKIYKNEGH